MNVWFKEWKIGSLLQNFFHPMSKKKKTQNNENITTNKNNWKNVITEPNTIITYT